MGTLLGILVVLLPLGTRKIFGHAGLPAHEWNAIFVSLTDAAALAALGWALACRRVREILQPVDAAVIALFFFLAAVGLSVARHGVEPLSAFRFWKLLLAAAVALLVRWAFRSGKGNVLLSLLVAAALLQSALATAQFFTQHDFGLQVFGESPLSSRAAGIAKIDVGSVKIVRAYGTFPHPNVLAGYLAASLFAVLALARAAPGGAKWLAAVFPLMLAIFVSFSRSAFAALAVGLAAISWYGWRHRRAISDHSRKMLVAFPYAIVLAAFVYGALFAPFYRTRAIPRAAEGAVVERVFYADAAIRMIRANPAFGVGWGRFSDRLAEYVEPKPVAVPSASFPLWLLQPVHNMYVLVAAEAGLGALVFFLVFVGILSIRAFARGTLATATFAAGFLVILAAGLFDHFPLTSQQGALAFWFFAGILMADRAASMVRNDSETAGDGR
jgi:O-antigen ligase